MDKTERMTNTVKDFVLGGGAVSVGIATTETLAGGPPSAELSHVLEGARSAVVFAFECRKPPYQYDGEWSCPGALGVS